MIEINISLEPVPWAAHRGFGKKSFNPRYKEREAYQWYIRQQYRGEPIEGAVAIFYNLYLPIPKSISKKLRASILAGEVMHTKRPDKTNCEKFIEDCLKGIVIVDDNQVWKCIVMKFYDEKPRVNILIEEFNATQTRKEQENNI